MQMDQSPLYNQYIPPAQTNVDSTDVGWWATTAWTGAQFRLPAYKCASDNADANASWGLVVLMHTWFDGTFVWLSAAGFAPPNNNLQGRTNYIGCAGRWGDISVYPGLEWTRDWKGVFTNRSKHGPRDCLDGTSNVFMFGEAIGGLAGGALSVGNAWIGIGAMPAWPGLSKSTTESQWYQFGSRHSGGVNFCFADGSVKSISRNINANVYLYLSCMADRNVVSNY
jgi:prepilin-type processing-associated H-X9-DG protein